MDLRKVLDFPTLKMQTASGTRSMDELLKESTERAERGILAASRGEDPRASDSRAA